MGNGHRGDLGVLAVKHVTLVFSIEAEAVITLARVEEEGGAQDPHHKADPVIHNSAHVRYNYIFYYFSTVYHKK